MISLSNASILVRTRMNHIGFPTRFTYYPEGMSNEIQDLVKRYVDDSTEEIEITLQQEQKIRKVIIRENDYVILGITAYLKEIMVNQEMMTIKAGQMIKMDIDDLTDDVNERRGLPGRPSYGFFAFVWKKEDFNQAAFPQISSFEEMISKYVLPHWYDSRNSLWAENTYSVPFGIDVLCDNAYTVELNESVNLEKPYNIMTFPVEMSNDVLNNVLCSVAEFTGKTVSLCTNGCFNSRESLYMNVTRDGIEKSYLDQNGRFSYENPQRKQPSAVLSPVPSNTENNAIDRKNNSEHVSGSTTPRTANEQNAYVNIIIIGIEKSNHLNSRELIKYINTHFLNIINKCASEEGFHIIKNLEFYPLRNTNGTQVACEFWTDKYTPKLKEKFETDFKDSIFKNKEFIGRARVLQFSTKKISLGDSFSQSEEEDSGFFSELISSIESNMRGVVSTVTEIIDGRGVRHKDRDCFSEDDQLPTRKKQFPKAPQTQTDIEPKRKEKKDDDGDPFNI